MFEITDTTYTPFATEPYATRSRLSAAIVIMSRPPLANQTALMPMSGLTFRVNAV